MFVVDMFGSEMLDSVQIEIVNNVCCFADRSSVVFAKGGRGPSRGK